MNNISQKLESRKPELPTDAIDKPTLEKFDAERKKIIENFSELGKSIFNEKNFPKPDLKNFPYKPNKTYLIDGERCRTDDRSTPHKINDAEERQNIDCLRNGDLSAKLCQNSTYIIDGHEYRTDDNGKVYCVDDKFRSSIEYKLNGYEFKTDDVGKNYLKNGELLPNNEYTKEKHTYKTNSNGDVFSKDGAIPKLGGSYEDVKIPGEGLKKEVHHMPSNDSTELCFGDGPTIKMDIADHRKTASCGNSMEARNYREMQRKFIEKNEFRKALQMDIDDIKEKFGDKYDEAISEMLEYVAELENGGKL